MKRPVLFVLLSALAFAASAQSASPTPEASVASTARQDVEQSATDQATSDQNASAKPRVLSDHNCLRQTGSRIIPRDVNGEGCAHATGRAYTREELDRTGGRDLAHSLRLLDPAIR